MKLLDDPLEGHSAGPFDQYPLPPLHLRENFLGDGLHVIEQDDPLGRHPLLSRALHDPFRMVARDAHEGGVDPSRLSPEFPVRLFTEGAEFEHVPQHEDAVRTAADLAECLQCGCHGCRVGVVAVIHDREILVHPDGEPALHRLKPGQSLPNGLQRGSKGRGKRHRSQGIGQVVSAGKVDFGGNLVPQNLDFHLLHSPTLFSVKESDPCIPSESKARFGAPPSLGQGTDARVVLVENEDRLFRHRLQHLALGLGHRLDRGKPLQVGGPHVEKRARLGLRDPGKLSNLARFVHPHLEDHPFVLRPEHQKRQGQADAVVEVPRAPQTGKTEPEDRHGHLFCGRLPVAPRQDPHRDGELSPPAGGKIPQGLQAVGHGHDGRLVPAQNIVGGSLLHHGSLRSTLEGILDESMPVEPLSSQGNEKVSGVHGPGIGRHAREHALPHACYVPASCKGHDFVQGDAFIRLSQRPTPCCQSLGEHERPPHYP